MVTDAVGMPMILILGAIVHQRGRIHRAYMQELLAAFARVSTGITPHRPRTTAAVPSATTSPDLQTVMGTDAMTIIRILIGVPMR